MNDSNFIDSDRNNSYYQDIFDPTTDNALVTKNPNYIAYQRINTYNRGSFLSLPPSYAESIINILYNGVTHYRIPVLFLGDVSESWGTNFIKENPVGSEFPIITFANSTNTQVSLAFTALSDYLPEGYSNFSNYIDTIRKMTKPKYSGDEVQAPKVTVSLPGYIFTGVCDSLSITYSQVYGDSSYVHATISCTFTISTLKTL